MLSEQPLPFFGARDGRILKRHVGGDRHLKNRPAAALENTPEFAHRLSVVGDVFENMAAVDDIERVIAILDVRDVHPHHRTGIGQVRREVIDVLRSLEPS